MHSSHFTDPLLQPFLSPNFSSTDYLNHTLPSLQPTSDTKTPNPQPSLSTLASQTQSHVSTLTAQTTRLSTILTALTDDILRTSSRLAYEIELLRGEALSLADAFSTTGALHHAITQFVPDGLVEADEDPSTEYGKAQEPTSSDPQPIIRLRTLLHVRSRLQTITQTFSLAMSWPLPPSLLISSLLSVTAPTDPTLEAKGQAACARFRQEVSDCVAEDRGDETSGLDKAKRRVGELRDCLAVWKGTSEEKVRLKFVEELERLVITEEEKRRKEEPRRRVSTAETRRRADSHGRGGGEAGGGPGFLRNLQRLREEIYME